MKLDVLRRCVLTGGPHSGKTTTVQELARRGFRVVPEAALAIISELTARHGLEGQRAWRASHPDEFQTLVSDAQVRAEDEVATERGLVFFDRGLLDGVAYSTWKGRPPPPALARRLGGERRYEHVVLLETIEPFYPRAETGRTSTAEGAVELAWILFDTYSANGYAPVRLPMLPLEERVARILRIVEG